LQCGTPALVSLWLLVLLGTVGVTAPAVAQPRTTRVSVSSAGAQGDDISYFAAISSSGRHVAFSSRASTLVAGDGNNAYDIFVQDRTLAQTRRVSVSSAGQEANSGSLFPAISGNGRFVSFDSAAGNLTAGAPPSVTNTFVHDVQTGQTTRVNVSTAGVAANSSSLLSDLSADGRFVAFSSFANNLVPNDNNASSFGGQDIFVHDRATGETTRVSVRSDGGEQNGFATNPSMSADGRFVAFESSATNLVPGDTSSEYDVFVHDRLTGETTRASVSSQGEGGNRFSVGPAISADGRFVAFSSQATNLVPNDTNGIGNPALGADIFVHDLVTRQTTRVSVSSSGDQANFPSYEPAMSANGRFVAFWSVANNLVAGDLNGPPPSLGGDIFVHDRLTGQTTLESLSTAGTQGEGLSSVDPIMSADGRFVAFDSEALGLVPEDTNGAADVFVRERAIPLEPTRVVSRKTHGTAGSFDIDLPFGNVAGVECRAGQTSGQHQLVLNFAVPVTFATAAVTSGTGLVAGTGTVDTQLTINLSGVTNAQTISVTLTGVTDGTTTNDVTVSMSVLTGDTNGDRSVNSGDAIQTRSRAGQATNASNFRSDVNSDGTVNSGDAIVVRSRSGTSAP
jgi:hypothetical protein